MILKTLHIKNNSSEFVDLMNKLKANKEAKVNALLASIKTNKEATK